MGPVATSDFVHMTNNPTGSGMGQRGWWEQFTTYSTMVGEGADPVVVLIKMALLHFILPAVLTLNFFRADEKKRLDSVRGYEVGYLMSSVCQSAHVLPFGSLRAMYKVTDKAK